MLIIGGTVTVRCRVLDGILGTLDGILVFLGHKYISKYRYCVTIQSMIFIVHCLR